MLIMMLVLFITISFLLYFNKKLKPLLLFYAENKIINEMKYLANSVVNKHYIKENYDYENFMMTVNNSKDEIVSIDFNTQKVNLILNEITNSMLLELKKIENKSFLNNETVYYIPFGIVTGLPSSNWIGPQIPVKVMTSGSVESKITTSLKNYGINNVLLEIGIEIDINTQILLPHTNKKVNTSLQVPLIQKIIQGKIPEIYGGWYGASSNILSEIIE